MYDKNYKFTAKCAGIQKAHMNAFFKVCQLRRQNVMLVNDDRGLARRLMEVRLEKENVP